MTKVIGATFTEEQAGIITTLETSSSQKQLVTIIKLMLFTYCKNNYSL